MIPRSSGGRAGRKIATGRGNWRIARDTPAATSAFTIVELLVVLTIILVLAGLILATSGYVHTKGARSRAEAEIAALSAALENYKADNGVYPSDATATDTQNPRLAGNPTTYQTASRFLYGELSGDKDFNGQVTGTETQNKTYFAFKQQQLGGTKDASGNVSPVAYIKDPFGYSYGYSSAGQAAITAGTPQTIGYNPTFDLWSTSGGIANPPASGTDTVTPMWVKNW